MGCCVLRECSNSPADLFHIEERLQKMADSFIFVFLWLFFCISNSNNSLELTNQVCGISQGAFGWDNIKIDAPYSMAQCAEICKASEKPNVI